MNLFLDYFIFKAQSDYQSCILIHVISAMYRGCILITSCKHLKSYDVVCSEAEDTYGSIAAFIRGKHRTMSALAYTSLG